MKLAVTRLLDAKGREAKPARSLVGEVDLDRDGNAYFHVGGFLNSQLSEARVVSISLDGFLLQGLERVGSALRFQKWWCRIP